jgi:hypothetical protein
MSRRSNRFASSHAVSQRRRVKAARRECSSMPTRCDADDSSGQVVFPGKQGALLVQQTDETARDVAETYQDELQPHFGLRIAECGLGIAD